MRRQPLCPPYFIFYNLLQTTTVILLVKSCRSLLAPLSSLRSLLKIFGSIGSRVAGQQHLALMVGG
jgi:hypothetical protein